MLYKRDFDFVLLMIIIVACRILRITLPVRQLVGTSTGYLYYYSVGLVQYQYMHELPVLDAYRFSITIVLYYCTRSTMYLVPRRVIHNKYSTVIVS